MYTYYFGMTKKEKMFHMKYTPFSYRIILKDLSEGKGEAFEAYVPAFQSHNFGDTPEDAINSYKKYFQSEVKRRKKEKISMPMPDIMEIQKQVPLRMNVGLYNQVADLAKQQGLSFNKFVVKTLEDVR